MTIDHLLLQDTNKVLAISRIMVAWQPVGLAAGVYDMVLRYMKEREQFNVPIAAFQASAHQTHELCLFCIRANALLWIESSWHGPNDSGLFTIQFVGLLLTVLFSSQWRLHCPDGRLCVVDKPGKDCKDGRQHSSNVAYGLAPFSPTRAGTHGIFKISNVILRISLAEQAIVSVCHFTSRAWHAG